VLELETGDNLLKYCRDRNYNLKEDHVKSICFKLAQGIAFLHEYSICLGKLTLTQIFMSDNSETAVPRIGNLS